MQEKLASETKVVRPSQIRHIVLAAICLLYLISYVDRVTISVAAPQISKEFHFTATEMGFIFAAFSFAYSLLPIFVGTFGDRLGPRRVLALLMGWWSIFTALTGVVTSFISFFIVRLLFGLGESGSFPAATRALASWYPPSARGFLQGVTHAAARIGAAISAPIIVAIVLIFHGWRWSFYLLGVLGIIWAVAFYFLFRDKPTEVAAVNEGEFALINQGRTRDIESKRVNPPVPWRKLLQGKDIWILSIIQFIYGYTFWIYLTWLPTYLTDSRHFSFVQLGIVASLPLFGGVLGDVLGGWLSDVIYKRTGNLNLARRIMITIAFIGAAAFTIPAVLVQSALVAELLIIGTMFMLECSVSSTWAVAMDIGGEYYSGTTSGFVSTAFGIAGIVAPILFGILKDGTGSWVSGFISGSVLLIIGAFIVFLINANNTLIPHEASTAETKKVNEVEEADETNSVNNADVTEVVDALDQADQIEVLEVVDEIVLTNSDEVDNAAESDHSDDVNRADNVDETVEIVEAIETDTVNNPDEADQVDEVDEADKTESTDHSDAPDKAEVIAKADTTTKTAKRPSRKAPR